MEEENKDDHILHRLIDQVNHHLETRWEYLSLSSTEKISAFAASVAGAAAVFAFAIMVLFFFTMGFAWWLGDYLGNRAAGFALTGLVFIPIAYIFNRWLRPFVREKIIQSILHQEEGPEKPSNHA